MNKYIILIFGLFLLAMIAHTLWSHDVSSPTVTEIQSELQKDIIVTSPVNGEVVLSPLTISGKARGSWYFEGSFPIALVDGAGKLIGAGHATAQGEWMTQDFVPFTATLIFTKPATGNGVLKLHNDNPSGDPTRDKSVEISVSY